MVEVSGDDEEGLAVIVLSKEDEIDPNGSRLNNYFPIPCNGCEDLYCGPEVCSLSKLKEIYGEVDAKSVQENPEVMDVCPRYVDITKTDDDITSEIGNIMKELEQTLK